MNEFSPGIDVLLSQKQKWLSGKRVGLVSHSAAVDSRGCLSADRLHKEANLTCLMGPEHGFFGKAGAGEFLNDAKHPSWNIPIFSLYGETRKPTRKMLTKVDTIIFDIQDIGARPYTFVSTLRYVLEAAAENDKEVIIADRPIPLPTITDGPVTEAGFSSFVAMVPTPMSYGMTPGETALWLKKNLNLKLNLKIAEMQSYFRSSERGDDWSPFIPPSPAIISWESATCFPVTVFCEGLTAIDCGRKTCLPFQLIGAKWIKGMEVAGFLSQLKLSGVKFIPHRYNSCPCGKKQIIIDGIWISVTDRNIFKPILTAVSIINCLQELYGKNRVWDKKTTRIDWFDKLFGTDTVRIALLDGDNPLAIANRWQTGLGTFNKSRRNCLIYNS
ncbi:MAG: DUF1343 domain-containing protein [Kiritimatiellae bacterium]|nr:DUF1343 domain-containing protein [Kiritimatiellia bacterium]MDD5520132.1 DUF1343 domain-containing protein [Kiritimatiellia bacterium]